MGALVRAEFKDGRLPELGALTGDQRGSSGQSDAQIAHHALLWISHLEHMGS